MQHLQPFNEYHHGSVRPVYYHFLDIHHMQHIVENGGHITTRPCDLKSFQDPTYYPDYAGYLSLTRLYNFVWREIRLTLDATRLRSDYKIVPLHYANKEVADHPDWYPELVNKLDHVDWRSPDTRQLHDYDKFGSFHKNNQQEERLLSRRAEQPIDLHRYLLAIDVSDQRGDWDYSAYGKEFDVPVNFVSKFRPYRGE